MISSFTEKYLGLTPEDYKLNEKYRLRMVVKCRLNAASRAFFRELLCDYASKRSVSLTVDLNPLSV